MARNSSRVIIPSPSLSSSVSIRLSSSRIGGSKPPIRFKIVSSSSLVILPSPSLSMNLNACTNSNCTWTCDGHGWAPQWGQERGGWRLREKEGDVQKERGRWGWLNGGVEALSGKKSVRLIVRVTPHQILGYTITCSNTGKFVGKYGKENAWEISGYFRHTAVCGKNVGNFVGNPWEPVSHEKLKKLLKEPIDQFRCECGDESLADGGGDSGGLAETD
ncbi:hypothetical protein LXL04_016104 [Taraxacum kok-saghyz]